MAFIVFNSTATNPPIVPIAGVSDWSAKTGNKAMISFAAGTAPWNNDWLISPQITLGSTGNVVSFWAKSCDTQYGSERFKVAISTTGTAVANFTTISPGSFITTSSNVEWVQYTYTLDATYNNLPVYIAINCVSQNQFGFAVDDFKVTTSGTVDVDHFFKENFTIFPNPTADVLNISSINGMEFQEVSIIDLIGRKVSSYKNSTAIDVSDLASGTYIIDIQTLEGRATSKFIKK